MDYLAVSFLLYKLILLVKLRITNENTFKKHEKCK